MIEIAQTHLLIAFAVFLIVQAAGLIRGLKHGGPLVGYFVFTLLGAGVGYFVLVTLPQVI